MPTLECAYDRIAHDVGMAEEYEVVRRQDLYIFQVLRCLCTVVVGDELIR